tara:strand:- start:352 stop:597 length:246 start_codon:yes stop_codon:yes gene_type:complete
MFAMPSCPVQIGAIETSESRGNRKYPMNTNRECGFANFPMENRKTFNGFIMKNTFKRRTAKPISIKSSDIEFLARRKLATT